MTRSRPPRPEQDSTPRFKKKKTPASPVVQKQIGDMGRVSTLVPDEVKVAMASAIMAYSQVEMSAEHFIWDALGLDIEDGKLVTQIDTSEKFALARKLSARYSTPIHPNEQSAAEAWALIRTISEARNKIAHGVWRMIDRATPIVVSYRIPIDPGQINSEHFPIDRMREIEAACLKLKARFDHMCREVRAGRGSKGPNPPPEDLEELPVPHPSRVR